MRNLIQVDNERDAQDENGENLVMDFGKVGGGDGKKGKCRCRIFVGRVTENLTTEDLRDHFEAFGQVTDVYIPKPFCQVAFVQFSECSVAQSLLGKELLIKGVSVKIGEAARRGRDDRGNMRGGGGGGDMFWEDRSGDYDSTGGGGSDGGWGGGNKGGFDRGGFSMNLGSGALVSSFGASGGGGLCRFCRKYFGRNSLMKHVRECRVGKFKFMCHLCERRFSNQQSLSTHICMKKLNPMHIRF